MTSPLIIPDVASLPAYEGRDLGYREIAEPPKRLPAVPVVRPKPTKYTPPATHPWKVYHGPAEIGVTGRP